MTVVPHQYCSSGAVFVFVKADLKCKCFICLTFPTRWCTKSAYQIGVEISGLLFHRYHRKLQVFHKWESSDLLVTRN